MGMFRDARFEVAGDMIVCTVPKGPPVDQLERRWPEVEQAVTAHFGEAVPLRLAIGAAASTAAAVADPSPDDEPVDVRELEDAPAGGTEVERLAEAFPGAELVDE